MSTRLYSKRAHLGRKSRGERIRPKSFASEAAAKDYAKRQDMKSPKVEQKGKKWIVVEA